MLKSAIVIGRGSSLKDSNFGHVFDTINLVIRVNHMPTGSTMFDVGDKTNIFACRDANKMAKWKSECIEDKAHVWYCHSHLFKVQPFIGVASIEGITLEEMSELRKDFYNPKDALVTEADKFHQFCLPDTGITAIWLAIHRLKDYRIYVAGFDHYQNGNTNIDETRSSASILRTPVLQQLLFYKKQLQLGNIHEVSPNSICL